MASSPYFHCASELSLEGSDHKLQAPDTRAGWRKIYDDSKRPHDGWHRSRCTREGSILNCSPTIKKKKRYFLSGGLWSWFLRHGNKMTWKIKLGGFQKQSPGFVAFFPHIFSADWNGPDSRSRMLSWTVRALIEVCSSSFSRSWFYEAVATTIVNIDYGAITASPVCLRNQSPKPLSASSSLDPTQALLWQWPRRPEFTRVTVEHWKKVSQKGQIEEAESFYESLDNVPLLDVCL